MVFTTLPPHKTDHGVSIIDHAPAVASTRASMPAWEYAFSIFALLLSTHAAVFLIGGEGDSVSGSQLQQGLWIVIYVFSVFLMFRSPYRGRSILRVRLPWLLVAWATLSVTWSAVPSVSAKRALALVGISMFGLYLGTRYDLRRLFLLVLAVVSISAVLSLLTVTFDPAIGTDGDAWRGIYGHKNWLSRIMVMSVLLWLLYISSSRSRYRLLGVAFMGLSLLLVVKSQAVTSLIVLAAMMLIMLLILALRLHRSLSIPSMALLVVLFLAALSWITGNYEEVLEGLGRDATLTGRTPLWELVWSRIQERPWIGYGYGGFWTGWDGPSRWVWLRTHWMPPHAHNGFLDLVLNVGFVGLGLFVVSILRDLARSAVLARGTRTPEASFPLVFLVLLLFESVSDSALLYHNYILWTLYMAVSARLSLDARRVGLEPTSVSGPPRNF